MSTPYDGKIGFAYVKSNHAKGNTIKEYAEYIQRVTPNVRVLVVKTSEGAQWNGFNDEQDDDSKPDLLIKSSADLSRWIDTFAQFGMEIHAWHVLRGINLEAEIKLIADVCNTPNLKSFVFDVEPGKEYFQGDAAAVTKIATMLRQLIAPDFHLGLCLIPLGNHPKDIHIQEWLPCINSLHPMAYHVTFGLSPEVMLQKTYNNLTQYGLPIIPWQQARVPNTAEIALAAQTATVKHQAKGLVYWRIGGILKESMLKAISQVPPPI